MHDNCCITIGNFYLTVHVAFWEGICPLAKVPVLLATKPGSA